jgi:hypothetical protein
MGQAQITIGSSATERIGNPRVRKNNRHNRFQERRIENVKTH